MTKLKESEEFSLSFGFFFASRKFPRVQSQTQTTRADLIDYLILSVKPLRLQRSNLKLHIFNTLTESSQFYLINPLSCFELSSIRTVVIRFGFISFCFSHEDIGSDFVGEW
jgi:hypothetical protein